MKQQTIDGSLLHIAHDRVRETVQPGDTVVDATVGNGHDTLFLAEMVSDAGKVIGFDVQPEAIESTRHRLENAAVAAATVELHQVGHELMSEFIPAGASAVMFNLGYLPGSDKLTITKVGTTLRALEAALMILKPDGLLSVMCYPGHAGGDDESAAVLEFFSVRSESGLEVVRYSRVGAGERSPFLILAERLQAT